MTSTSAPRTRRVTVSARKVAEAGADYWQQFLGLQVVYTAFDGEQLVGVVEGFANGYPVIWFADGRWARGDLDLRVVVDEQAAKDARAAERVMSELTDMTTMRAIVQAERDAVAADPRYAR